MGRVFISFLCPPYNRCTMIDILKTLIIIQVLILFIGIVLYRYWVHRKLLKKKKEYKETIARVKEVLKNDKDTS